MLVFSLTACVGPGGRPVGGLPFGEQGSIAGAVGGALAGWGLSKSMDANKNQQILAAMGGSALGEFFGRKIGINIQDEYDQNTRREQILDQQIATAENRISAARKASQDLNLTIRNLSSTSSASTREKARVQLKAAKQLAREVDDTRIAVQKTRRDAENAGMRNQASELRQKEQKLNQQNAVLNDKIRQLEQKDNSLTKGGRR